MEERALVPDIEVVDCDGHMIESVQEMAQYMSPRVRLVALEPERNRQSVFPSIDGIHYPRGDPGGRPPGAAGSSGGALTEAGAGVATAREWTAASGHRRGSPEDLAAFLDRTGIEQAVLFTSEGLSVGFIQQADYAIELCRAYNDYVAAVYAAHDPRLRPMALLPLQDAPAAARELRRAVGELGLPGAMLPSRGLPLHLGHEYYLPVYEAAEDLGCPLGIHGGSSLGFGADSFTDAWAARVLRHPVPLALALVSLVFHGVLDRLPGLRVGFFEGGCAWLGLVLDRVERDEEVYVSGIGRRSLRDYLADGRVLVGCEGNEAMLPFLIGQVGHEPFAYASDYPHEVDALAARKMIEETLASEALSEEAKRGVLGANAKRFFGLA